MSCDCNTCEMLPVHDDAVWNVDAVQVPAVMRRVGEKVQAVPRPVVWDLPVKER